MEQLLQKGIQLLKSSQNQYHARALADMELITKRELEMCSKFIVTSFFILFLNVLWPNLAIAQDESQESFDSFIDTIVNQDGVTFPENYQLMIVMETSVNPSFALAETSVQINGKTETYFKLLDAVIFRRVKYENAKRMFEKFSTAPQAKPFAVYVRPRTSYSVDMIFINSTKLEDLCKMRILGFSDDKDATCQWHNQWQDISLLESIMRP